MELEPKPVRTLAQYAENPLGIKDILKRQDGIVISGL